MARLFCFLMVFMVVGAVSYSQTNTSSETLKSTNTNISEEKEIAPTGGDVYNDGKMDYVSSKVLFNITAKDEGSGIKAIYCAMDGSAFSVFDRPVAATNEGVHTILYKVEDNVGNVSPVKGYGYCLDLSAPSVLLAPDKKPVKIGDVLYAGSNFTYYLDALDLLSGVKTITYGFDDAAETVYKNGFSVNGTNGMHRITYYAADNVGNVSSKTTYSFFLDVNPPAVKFTVDPSPYETNGVKYIAPKTRIGIDAADAETGVMEIQYSVDSGMFTLYTGGNISLPGGAHTIKARASDLLGNWSEEVTLNVTVDETSPEADLSPVK